MSFNKGSELKITLNHLVFFDACLIPQEDETLTQAFCGYSRKKKKTSTQLFVDNGTLYGSATLQFSWNNIGVGFAWSTRLLATKRPRPYRPRFFKVLLGTFKKFLEARTSQTSGTTSWSYQGCGRAFPKVGSGEIVFRKPIAERETSKIFFGGGSNYSEHPPRAPIFPPWCKFFYLEKNKQAIQSDGSSWKVVIIVTWSWGYYMLHDMGIIIMFIDTNIYKFRSCGYLKHFETIAVALCRFPLNKHPRMLQ